MAKAAVKNKIKNMSALWSAAKEKTAGDTMGDFVPVDPGIYNMQLVAADIGEYGGALKLRSRWCVLDDGDDRGKICTQFDQCDTEDKMVWLIRLMKVMGIDMDSEPSDASELESLFVEKVSENLVCRVKVTEKEGYVNTRVQKVIEVDDSELVDPDEALGGKPKKAAKTEKVTKGKKEEKEEEVDDADQISFEEGDKVSWENDDGDTVTGEIVGFTDDESAKVRADGEKKSSIKSLELLTKIEEEAIEKKPLAKPSNKSSRAAAKGNAKEEKEEEEEVEVEEEGRELKVGDKVVATIKGKDKSAIVKSIDAENGKIKVKVGNELHTVGADDVSFEVDE